MSDRQPDPRPGFYYVTAILRTGTARLLGPFVDDHAGALAAVSAARAEAIRRNRHAAGWAFGTGRFTEDLGEGPLGRRLTGSGAP